LNNLFKFGAQNLSAEEQRALQVTPDSSGGWEACPCSVPGWLKSRAAWTAPTG